jgi:hypothetical protein
VGPLARTSLGADVTGSMVVSETACPGSNPGFPARAPVAQLVEAIVGEAMCGWFESSPEYACRWSGLGPASAL